jgi:cysteinyl-tRNA synthetase
MDKGKMSKSSGEFLTLQYLIDKGFDPLDYRFFLLGGHYRSQLTFSWESMESARNSRRSLVQRLARITENAEAVPESLPANSPANEWIDRFRADIEQDLSTPRALSQLQGLIRDTDVPPAEALAAVARMDQVLGLDLIESAASLVASSKETGDIDDGRIDALIAERTDAKKAKNFSRADEIRNQLKESGIILEDTASGTTWRRSIGEK